MKVCVFDAWPAELIEVIQFIRRLTFGIETQAQKKRVPSMEMKEKALARQSHWARSTQEMK